MIVDASVAFKWLVAEDDSPLAIMLLQREDLSSPFMMLAEVGNALSKRLRNGQMNDGGAAEKLTGLPKLVTLVDEAPYLGAALDLAVAINHSFYDCIYFAMADARGEPLVTSDGVFARKVRIARPGAKLLLLTEAAEI